MAQDKEEKLTERQVQLMFYARFGRQKGMIIPNFTPRNWHEADIWRVSAAGRSTEVEIKLSTSDFRQDVKKVTYLPDVWADHPEWRAPAIPPPEGHTGYWHDRARGQVLKRRRLEAGDQAGPNRYSYLVPTDILDVVKKEAPKWAGILELRKGVRQWFIYPVREPKMLHKERMGHDVLAQLTGVCYWRYWNLLPYAARSKAGGDLDELLEQVKPGRCASKTVEKLAQLAAGLKLDIPGGVLEQFKHEVQLLLDEAQKQLSAEFASRILNTIKKGKE